MLGTPVHSWQAAAQAGMAIGDRSLLFAAKVMARSGLELLRNADLLSEVRAEWETRRGGREYRAVLPPDAQPPKRRAASGT